VSLTLSREWRPVPVSPLVSRRQLIGGGAVALVGLSLPGCVTVPQRSSSLCLPPVRVSDERVQRVTVGLRPYRSSGFVVRAEPLGAKRLVHNYGHGGAGISLSWGSSRLAVELGLPGHSGAVAVLGAGVMGLTTARLLQEEGFAVTIYAEKLPPDTTSNVSGGQWLPTGHYDESAVSAAWNAQYLWAADYAYRRFRAPAAADYARPIRNYLQSRTAEPGPRSRIEALLPGHKLLGPGEHPFPADYVRAFDGMIVEPPKMLDRLMGEIRGGGGRIVQRRIDSPADIEQLPEGLVFNCTGLGSAALFGDSELVPARGQLVWLEPQPEIDYSWSGSSGYMFPRPDAIILGGTFEEGDWSTVPDPDTTARILGSHAEAFAAFRC
jgi:D-amino-acid oxidase